MEKKKTKSKKNTELKNKNLASDISTSSKKRAIAKKPVSIKPAVEPVVEPVVEQTMEPTIKPVVESTTAKESVLMEPAVESTMESTMEPAVESTMEPSVEQTVENAEQPDKETKSILPQDDKDLVNLALKNKKSSGTDYLQRRQKALKNSAIMLEKSQKVEQKSKTSFKEWIIKKIKTYATDLKFKIPFINKATKFDWEDFEKNVQYDTFSDGTKLKIAAEIKDIQLSFANPATPGVLNKVLRGPSLKIYEGKIHAIIGESGSGKSVITSLLYGLAGTNARIQSGEIKLYNNNVEKFSFQDWERSHYRGKVISAIFQNPMSTLNPTMKVGPQITEGMLINGIVKTKKEAYARAVEFLRLTKIEDPEGVMKLYPHEMSGGMIQRVVIAAIVALEPKILVMDEPTTALDPTVQALVLDVVRELQEKLKMSIVFITHDLGVVASISDYISIMYAGQIIEEGLSAEILEYPQHPYTWGLISSMPDVNQGTRLETIRGSVPSSLNAIKGDAFAVRNDFALEIDLEVEPNFYQISETHKVKSALLDTKAPLVTPPELIAKKWHKYFEQNQLETAVESKPETTTNTTTN